MSGIIPPGSAMSIGCIASLEPRADRNINSDQADPRDLVLQLASQLRATGYEAGELAKHLGIGSNKAFNVVTCEAARTLDSCRIAIYEALRNWRSSR